MTNTFVEVRDLRSLEPGLLRELKRHTFGEEGWMCSSVDQILRGYAAEWPDYNISYARGHALIARDENNKIMGWGLVRHPRRRLAIKDYSYNFALHKMVWNGRYIYAGRRSDFMVYVRESHRRRGLARLCLLVAYNNFGRVDVYPHDTASDRFYERNSKFVTAYNTSRFGTAQFDSREIF